MKASFLAGCRAVLFDMDDTLYPERSYVLSGFHAAAVWLESQTGRTELETEPLLVDLFAQGIRGNTFDRWLEQLGLSVETWLPGLVEIYRSHDPDIAPFLGIVELLDNLGERALLGLVSDGVLAAQRRKLAVLGLSPYFDCVTFSDEWGRSAWKPSPKPFLEALTCLEARGAAAVYVADNPTKDFIGARRLGMRTVRLRHSEGIYVALQGPTAEHDADIEVSDVSDLALLLHG